MRRTLLVGAVIAVATTLVVLLSDLLDLDVVAVALLGVTVGAVTALVPDRSPTMRLTGFLIGFVVAWIAYVLRAGLLPDSTGGRAVAVFVVLAVCTAVAALSSDRVPLWSTLLGAAAMAGTYEYTFTQSPPEVMTTSVTAATSLLLTAGLGYVLVSLLTPREAAAGATSRTSGRPPRPANDPTALDEMMETSR